MEKLQSDMGDPPSQLDRIIAGLDRLERAIDDRSDEDDLLSIDELLRQRGVRVIRCKKSVGDYWLGPEESAG